MSTIERVQGLAAVAAVLLLFAPPARPAQQPWTEVKSPHFLVVTNGSEKQARGLAEKFEQIRSVFELTLRFRVESGKPFVVMAFKDEKSTRAAFPEYWEKRGRSRPAGMFLPGAAKTYAVVRLDVEGDNPFHVVIHEYTHMVLNLNFRSLPLWLSEGLAEFYGNSVIAQREVQLGKPSNLNLQVLSESPHLSLDELFRVDRESPYYRDAGKAAIFYAESWALTHYLILGQRTAEGQDNRLTEFLKLISQGVDEDEAVRRALGDLGELRAGIETYMRRAAFPYVRFLGKAPVAPEEFRARALSPAEALARLGDLKLQDSEPDAARPLLEEALKLQPDLAAAKESMGLLCLQKKDLEGARSWFDQAIAADPQSFAAHYYLATLILAGKSGAEETARAEASLKKAIQLSPYFAPALAALARLYQSDDKTLDRALEVINRAIELEPGSFSNQMLLATLLVRKSRYGEALKVAKSMERLARSSAERSMVKTFVEGVTRLQGKVPGAEAPAIRRP